MVFDDISYLQQNPLFLDSQSFSFPFHYQEFLQKPGKLGFDPELAMNFVLRPVTYATLHLNYLFDGFNPRWYRLFNVTIHALNACLIYAVLQMLLIVAKSSMNITSKRRVSAIAATLFAVHPLAIESVTYIVQRFTSLGAFFYLLTLLLQICAWSDVHEARRQKWGWAALWTLLLGLFTKECTITAPFMLVLIDVMICRTHWRDALRRNRLLLACLPIIPLHVMLISFVQNAGSLNLDHAMNMTNMQAAPYLYWDFALTQTTVLMHYFRLILWPSVLVLDPEWPLYHSVFAGPVLSSTLLILAIVGLALWMMKPAQASLSRHLGGLGLLWFFITIIPSSGLVPLPDLVAEHRSYLPSVGIFIACALLLDFTVSKLALLARFS